MRKDLIDKINKLEVQEKQKKGNNSVPFSLFSQIDSEGIETRMIPFFNNEGYNNEISVLSSANGCKSPKLGINLVAKLNQISSSGNTVGEEIYHNSALSGHNAVDELAGYKFILGKGNKNGNGVTRLETLFLCQTMYGFSALQQSMRFVDASNLFKLKPDSDYKFDKILSSSIRKSQLFNEVRSYLNFVGETYEVMQKGDNAVKTEVARMITPLCTPTNIEFNINSSALKDLISLGLEDYMPSRIKRRVSSMAALAKHNSGLLFSDQALSKLGPLRPSYPNGNFLEEKDYLQDLINNKTQDIELIDFTQNMKLSKEVIEGALNNERAAFQYLKQFRFTFTDKKSLIVKHQDDRQRTKDMSCESIYNAINRGEYEVPSSIKGTVWEDKWHAVSQKGLSLYHQLVDEGIPKQEALDVIPQNLQINTIYTLNGWNLVKGAMDRRLCENAQPEIRKLYEEIRNIIVTNFPVFKFAIGPPCTKSGCNEKQPCGNYAIVKEKYK